MKKIALIIIVILIIISAFLLINNRKLKNNEDFNNNNIEDESINSKVDENLNPEKENVNQGELKEKASVDNSKTLEVTVIGTEFNFNPSSITVKYGEKVKITFINQGKVPHNLVLGEIGVKTDIINPGEQDVVEFTAQEPGTYSFICSIPGHKEAGMEGELTVE